MTHELDPPLQPADFRIVDLFAGPGGLDIAATIMGVESIGVEWDDATRATRDAAGLLTTMEKDVAALGPCDAQVKDANVLTGGPPCQSFSVAGSRKGHKALEDVKRLATCLVAAQDSASFETVWAAVQADPALAADERTGLVLQPLRWIMEAKFSRHRKPYKVVILEQVPTVLPVWNHYAELLRKIGYAAEAHVLHAEDFGVPQTRRRAVLIAQYDPGNETRDVPFPKATHQRYRKGIERLPAGGSEEHRSDGSLFAASRGKKIEPWVSMQDALGSSRPQDFVMVSNYGSGGDPKNRGRRTSLEPAATITGKCRRNRLFLLKEGESGAKEVGEELDRLSFEEAGLLQSFPARYPWQSTDVAQQIGNAIPPRLSLHILSSALGFGQPDKDVIDKLAAWKPEPGAASADEDSANDD